MTTAKTPNIKIPNTKDKTNQTEATIKKTQTASTHLT